MRRRRQNRWCITFPWHRSWPTEVNACNMLNLQPYNCICNCFEGIYGGNISINIHAITEIRSNMIGKKFSLSLNYSDWGFKKGDLSHSTKKQTTEQDISQMNLLLLIWSVGDFHYRGFSLSSGHSDYRYKEVDLPKKTTKIETTP